MVKAFHLHILGKGLLNPSRVSAKSQVDVLNDFLIPSVSSAYEQLRLSALAQNLLTVVLVPEY